MEQKLLFTPGPLTTSPTVKAAMQRDLGSRDYEFIGVIASIRKQLVQLAGASADDYTAIIVQGSGTFGIESVLSSTIPADGKLLALINGAYGRRMVQIARAHKIETLEMETSEDVKPDVAQVADLLAADPAITDVAVVHCETTSGIINPIQEIAQVVKGAGRRLIVDAMSSFGAYPIEVAGWGIDYLISSSNKCIEGVPGFSFVIANKATLTASAGHARGVSLDLLAQARELDKSGQFRFTPPTHVLLAFHQALAELDAEGGIGGRAERYQTNHQIIADGMRALGFETYLEPADQGYIITSFRYPEDPHFQFEKFYAALNDKGFVIYPGKVTRADCFRIGHIGRLTAQDSQNLIKAIKTTLDELGIVLTPAKVMQEVAA